MEKAVAESREAKLQSINADYRTFKRSKSAPWIQAYKWSILCFIAVGFWNVISAGLLGFTINTPIALYYMQGLNMTSAQGHAALFGVFGVYGMLGIGLLLFCLRGLSDRARWSDKLLAPMFWCLVFPALAKGRQTPAASSRTTWPDWPHQAGLTDKLVNDRYLRRPVVESYQPPFPFVELTHRDLF